MRSLSLSVPHVVVMVGIPGSGKSFFAERFSETFSVPLVSWGMIRDVLFNEATHADDEYEIINRVGQHMLAQLFQTGATLLYEGGCLTHDSRKDLAAIIRKAGYEPLFVWVQTDLATTRARALKHGTPADVHAAAVSIFTPPKDKEPFVVISGKHTYASQLKIVLKQLSSQRVAAVAKSQPVRRAPAALARPARKK